MGKKLPDTGLGTDISACDAKTQVMGAESVSDVVPHPTEKLSHGKRNDDKMKRQEIFANRASDKGLISKIYEELTQLNSIDR